MSHITPQDIVTQARTWLGTKYHHQGRVKGSGCDCIGLVIGVMRDLEILSTIKGKDGKPIPLCCFDESNYSTQPSGDCLLVPLGKYMQSIEIKDAAPGDLLVFRFGNNPQHIGIVSDYVHGGLGIIHTYASANNVVEHVLSDSWKKRTVAAYRFPTHLWGEDKQWLQ